MPANREVGRERKHGKLGASDSDVSNLNDFDTWGYDLSVETAEKSHKMAQIRQSEGSEDVQPDERNVLNARDAEVRAAVDLDNEEHLEEKFNLEDINEEIEDLLLELEQLKAKVIPIMDRRDFKPEALSAAPAEPETPPAILPMRLSFESTPSAPPAISDAEDNLDNPDFAEPDRESFGGHKRWRKALLTLVVVILAGAFGYLLFFKPDTETPASRPSARNTGSATEKASGAAEDPIQAAVIQSRQTGSNSAANAAPNSSNTSAARSVLPGTQSADPVRIGGAASVTQPKSPSSVSLQPPASGTGPASSNPVIPRRPPIANPAGSSARVLPKAARTEGTIPAAEKSEAEPPKAADVPPVSSTMAETILRVKAIYPEEAKEQKISGIVELEADINERGDVVRAKAVSGPELLRRAAEDALMKWKFKPASFNGANIASQARISISFNPR